jgi:hypothetical protein
MLIGFVTGGSEVLLYAVKPKREKINSFLLASSPAVYIIDPIAFVIRRRD